MRSLTGHMIADFHPKLRFKISRMTTIFAFLFKTSRDEKCFLYTIAQISILNSHTLSPIYCCCWCENFLLFLHCLTIAFIYVPFPYPTTLSTHLLVLTQLSVIHRPWFMHLVLTLTLQTTKNEKNVFERRYTYKTVFLNVVKLNQLWKGGATKAQNVLKSAANW